MAKKRKSDQLEQKIQDEIRQAVIRKSMKNEEEKKRLEEEAINLEVLQEMSGLSKKEIKRIAASVRSRHSQPPFNLSRYKTPLLVSGGLLVIAVVVLTILQILPDSSEQVAHKPAVKKVVKTIQVKQQVEIKVVPPQKKQAQNKTNQQDINAFMKSAASGNNEMLQHLLTKQIDVNVRDRYGNTALIIAASRQRVNTVKLLLEKKADLTIKNNKQFTALDYAKIKKSKPLLHILGLATSKSYVSDPNIQSLWKMKMPFCQVCFTEAVKEKKFKEVELFLKTDIDVNIKSTAPGSEHALTYAADKGYTEVAQAVLDARDDFSKNHLSRAVWFAARYERLEILKMLAEEGADLNYQMPGTGRPLHIASKKPEVLKLLVHYGANLEATGFNRQTVLVKIAAEKQGKKPAKLEQVTSVYQMLLDAGANPNARDSYGKSAIDYVNEWDPTDKTGLKALLRKHGAEEY